MKLAREVKEPRFEAREVIGEKDAKTLAREILALSEDEFSIAFKGSAMQRARAAGLSRRAASPSSLPTASLRSASGP